MSVINDSCRNAVVGKLLEVASRSWGDDRRMVVVRTDDPFVPVTVRSFVRNFEDAEALVDTIVVVYEDMVYRLAQP